MTHSGPFQPLLFCDSVIFFFFVVVCSFFLRRVNIVLSIFFFFLYEIRFFCSWAPLVKTCANKKNKHVLVVHGNNQLKARLTQLNP